MKTHSPIPPSTKVPFAGACPETFPFMVFENLFGDGSPEGNLVRCACLPATSHAPCLPCAEAEQTRPVNPDTPLPPLALHPQPQDIGLPRPLVRDAISRGQDIELHFSPASQPGDNLLHEIAHLTRKLRNSGIRCEVSGLSLTSRQKLAQFGVSGSSRA